MKLVKCERALFARQDSIAMLIQIDENISIEIYFDLADREDGYEDDIRFRIIETGPKENRIFAADETAFLLTPEHAEQLALALQKAATQSKKAPL